MTTFRTVWAGATAPAARIEDPDQVEQARLLAGISLVLLLAGSIIILIWITTNPEFTAAPWIGITLIFVLLLQYIFSRTWFFRQAAIGFIGLFFLAILAVVSLAPGTMTDRMLVLSFLVIPVFLASIFFDFAFTIFVSVVSVLTCMVFLFIPAAHFAIAYAFVVLNIVTSALLLLTKSMRDESLQRRRESERRYRALFEQGNSGVCLMDLAGTIREINDHATAVLGYSRQELLGTPLRDLVAPADLAASDAAWARMVAGERIPLAERSFLRKDGRFINVEVNMELVRDVQGQPMHIQSVLHDITERKAAEKALRDSEARFRQLTEQSPDFIYILNCAQNKLVFANRQAFLGYDLSTLQDLRLWVKHVYQPDQERVTALWQQLQAGNVKTVHILDYRIKHKAGHWEWIFLRAIPLSRSAQGETEELLVTLTSITEQKRLQSVLQEREEQFQMVVETMRVIPWVFDMTTERFTYVGPQAEEMLGYPVAQWYEKKFWPRHVHADDWPRVYEISMRGVTHIQNYNLDYRMVAADGRFVWLHELVTVQFDETGRKILRGLMIDVTDRRAAEEKLAHQEEQLRILLEQAPIGIVTVDNNGIVSAANPRSLEILGSPGIEHTLGLNVLTLPQLVETGASAAFAQALETGEMVQIETPYMSLWGKPTFVMTRVRPPF
jgi:PAS domain S-box-containing protein